MRMVDIIEKKRDGKELTTAEINFFIENLLSLVTFFIPLIVSFGMMVLSKTHQNFNEYITNTYSLSFENKKFYKDYNEYLYLTMKEKEN